MAAVTVRWRCGGGCEQRREFELSRALRGCDGRDEKRENACGGDRRGGRLLYDEMNSVGLLIAPGRREKS